MRNQSTNRLATTWSRHSGPNKLPPGARPDAPVALSAPGICPIRILSYEKVVEPGRPTVASASANLVARHQTRLLFGAKIPEVKETNARAAHEQFGTSNLPEKQAARSSRRVMPRFFFGRYVEHIACNVPDASAKLGAC
jgi:hypothetical protein